MNSACSVKFFLYFFTLTILDIIRVPETSGYSVNSSYATYNFARTRRQAKQCDGSDQFQCLSGDCISLDDKCDGKTECRDKSDETKETCLNTYCPGYTFKCYYGACVDFYARCNGYRDCVDNSDEEDCENETTTTQKPPTPVPTTPLIGGCRLPDHPENGKWVIQGGAAGKPGHTVGVNTHIIYFCDKGYKQSREGSLVACLADGWSGKHPRCLRLCPALYNTASTKVQCFDKDKTGIKCDEATDRTSAEFECATYYEPADRHISIRHCSLGSWNLPPPQCIPG